MCYHFLPSALVWLSTSNVLVTVKIKLRHVKHSNDYSISEVITDRKFPLSINSYFTQSHIGIQKFEDTGV